MSKRRNLKKEKQERNRAYARKFKKRKLRTDGRPDGGNVTVHQIMAVRLIREYLLFLSFGVQNIMHI